MITEELITYPTAQLAKQAGFDLQVPHYFTPKGVSIAHTREGYHQEYYCYDVDDFVENWNHKGLSVTVDDNISYGGGYMIPCSQPTQSLLQRWIREVGNVIVYCEFIPSPSNRFRPVIVQQSKDGLYNKVKHLVHECNSSYELALEQALQEALTIIINRKETNNGL